MNRFFGRLFSFPSSRGPLPEVQESDWAQWEASVVAWQESDGAAAVASDVQTLPTIPEPTEVDWAAWEQALHAA